MSRKNRTKRKRAPHTAAQNSANGNRPSKCFKCFLGTLKIVVLPFFVSIRSIRKQGDGPGYGRRQKKNGGLEGVIGGVIGPSYVHTIEGHGVLWE